MANVCVYLSMLEAFLQIFVDCLVRDFAEQCEVRHTDFFLLGDFECRLLDLRLSIFGAARLPASEEGGFSRPGSLFATFCLTLFD